jgi:hypothetical protein
MPNPFGALFYEKAAMMMKNATHMLMMSNAVSTEIMHSREPHNFGKPHTFFILISLWLSVD